MFSGVGLVINNKHLGERDLNCRFVRAVMKSRAEATKHPDEAIKALLEMYPKAGEFEAAKAILGGNLLYGTLAPCRGETSGIHG